MLRPREGQGAPGTPIHVPDNEAILPPLRGLGAGGHSQWLTVATAHQWGPEVHGEMKEPQLNSV